MTTWRYITPELINESDWTTQLLTANEGNQLFQYVFDCDWELVVHRLSCLWNDGTAEASVAQLSDANVDIVLDELNGIDPNTGNTILHKAIDNQAPLAVIRALLLQDPFCRLDDLVPFEDNDPNQECRPLAAIKNFHGDTALHRVTFNSSDVQVLKLVCLAYPNAALTKNDDVSSPAFYACSLESPLRALYDILEQSTTASEESDDCTSHSGSSNESEIDEPLDHDKAMSRSQGKTIFQMLKKCSAFEIEERKDAKRPIRLLSIMLDICPKEAILLTDAYDCTLHHFGLLQSIDDEGLTFLCRLYPEGCKVQNKFGCTPLQAAVRMSASFSQIKMLVNCAPVACSVPNRLGYLPFTRAIENKMSTETLEFLLEVFPLAPLHVTKKGLNAFDLLDITYDAPKTLPQAIQDPMQEHIPNDFKEWWERANLMVKFISMTRDPQKVYRPLHAFVSMEVTKTMLEVVLWQYPLLLREPDEHGRYPIHIACNANATHGLGINPPEGQVVVRDESEENIVSTLMRMFPDPTRLVDKWGCLPLHLAIKSGVVQKSPEVMESLLMAAPSSLAIMDVDSKLYPFQLAATLDDGKYDVSQTHTIYRLLRSSPWLLSR